MSSGYKRSNLAFARNRRVMMFYESSGHDGANLFLTVLPKI